MKTVLIPTDFTLASLHIVRQAAAYFDSNRISVVLFHALYMPADIHGLLSVSSRVPHEKITEAFRQACAAIRKKHSNVIAGVSFQHLYGNTAAVFRNFTETHHIDCIFLPAHVQLKCAYPNSVEARSLFRHTTIPLISDTTTANKKPPFYQVVKDRMPAGV